MREIVAGLLWIGNSRDLREPAATLSHGVQAVVDLAASEPPAAFPRDIVYCRVPLCDGAENSEDMLRLAVSTTLHLVRANVPTLVACSMGVSRSPAIVAAALALLDRRRPDDALARIANAGPLDVDPALWGSLRRLYKSTPASEADVSLELLVIRTVAVERLLEFYRRLGLQFVEERHGNGPLHHSTALGPAVMEIYPAATPAEVDAATRLGFRVGDIATTVEALRAAGAPIVSEPKAGAWGMRAVVRDPDDRAVELYQTDG